eukprot:gnl/MRDRNA2_/MRDRNA2_556646_c0_seq1.p2 gnl/MRDRNA2_/MRDRNA2_556646_c0~~gnl/MRDRNA2_/MRDRNA2_556646_c0_seq1.p2  ORF type:complete len:113 (+),score=2.76 gnl/MRDRNA2_/MRDRNA2_556646_c0_seq1:205-543(+)
MSRVSISLLSSRSQLCINCEMKIPLMSWIIARRKKHQPKAPTEAPMEMTKSRNSLKIRITLKTRNIFINLTRRKRRRIVKFMAPESIDEKTNRSSSDTRTMRISTQLKGALR